MPTAMMPPMTAAVVDAKPSSRRKPGAETGEIRVSVFMSDECDHREKGWRYASWMRVAPQ